MCNPIVIGLAIGGLSAVSAQRAQKAQHEAAAAAYEANAENTLRAKVTTDRQANLNLLQMEEKAAEEKVRNALNLRRAVSRAELAQAASGAMANNNAVVQDMRRQGLMQENMAAANMSRRLAQFGEGQLGAESTYTSRINSVARPEWDSSSALTTSLLQGTQAGLSAGAAAQSMGIGSGGGTVAASTTTGSQSATRNVFTGNTPQMSVGPSFSFN